MMKRRFPPANLLASAVAGAMFLLATYTVGALAQTPTGTIIDTPATLDPGEVFRIEDGELRQIAFSPDEALLAVASSAGLWVYAPNDSTTGELLASVPALQLWWSGDSTLLAVALDNGSLQLWQIPERRLLGAIDGTAGAIVAVAWAPDGNEVATGSADGVIEVWNVSEGVVLETLEGHTGRIRNLFWIAGGAQIVSAADDGSVRVWGVEVATAPPTPTPTAALQPAFATVQVNRLRVREGAGTNFAQISTALLGEQLTVLDQENDCEWLLVRTPAGVEGWVAGAAQFVTLDVDCDEVGQVVIPSTPLATVQPTLPTPTVTPTAATAAAAATPTAATTTPAAASTVAPDDPFPPDQGCYLFQNELTVDLTIVMERPADDFSQTIELPAKQEQPVCFDPGEYTYTIRYQVDSTSPAAEIPGTLTVSAGERFMFPIRAQD